MQLETAHGRVTVPAYCDDAVSALRGASSRQKVRRWDRLRAGYPLPGVRGRVDQRGYESSGGRTPVGHLSPVVRVIPCFGVGDRAASPALI